MGMRFSLSLRSTRNQDIVTAAGANAKVKFYDGAVPASGGGAAAGNLLATLVGGATLGTSTNGVMTFGAVTQNNANHVAGTPTFARITTSADVFVADIDIGSGAGKMQFSGSIAPNVDVSLSTSTIAEGNQ